MMMLKSQRIKKSVGFILWRPRMFPDSLNAEIFDCSADVD